MLGDIRFTCDECGKSWVRTEVPIIGAGIGLDASHHQEAVLRRRGYAEEKSDAS